LFSVGKHIVTNSHVYDHSATEKLFETYCGNPSQSKIWFENSAPLAPLANSTMTSILTVCCRCKDETAKERTGHPRLRKESC